MLNTIAAINDAYKKRKDNRFSLQEMGYSGEDFIFVDKPNFEVCGVFCYCLNEKLSSCHRKVYIDVPEPSEKTNDMKGALIHYCNLLEAKERSCSSIFEINKTEQKKIMNKLVKEIKKKRYKFIYYLQEYYALSPEPDETGKNYIQYGYIVRGVKK